MTPQKSLGASGLTAHLPAPMFASFHQSDSTGFSNTSSRPPSVNDFCWANRETIVRDVAFRQHQLRKRDGERAMRDYIFKALAAHRVGLGML